MEWILLTLPLVLLAGLVLQVFVLRVGTQVLGAKKPSLAACVGASIGGAIVAFVAQIVLGCTVGLLVSLLGSGPSLVFSVMVALASQAAVYSGVLRLDGVRAVILSLATTVTGWTLGAAWALAVGLFASPGL